MTTITMFLTIAISLTIGALFLYFILKPTRRNVVSAPSILTSIGIFGTFLGIAIGLTNFDPSNVIAGVPVFLSGIKLAFWSSVIGIFAALLHRVKYSLSPFEDEGSVEAEIDDAALNALLQNLNTLGDRVETSLDNMAGGVSKEARNLVDELKADDSVITMLRELREELSRTSNAEQNIIKAQMQRLIDELKDDALAGEKQSDSLLEVFAGLKSQLEKGSEHGIEASKEQMEFLFSGLSRAAAGTLGELSEVAQNLIDQTKWQASNLADEVTASNEASTKSMLAMLKDILHATEDSNQKITSELAKLRTDVAADIRATTNQSKALIEQLHSMTEASKASLIATTTELKTQITKDMKASYTLMDKYTQNIAEITGSNQAESHERLEAIANIMQNVVSSASDMSSLLHDNAAAMSKMQESFTGTSEGSLGRFMLDMNQDLIMHVSSLENAFSAQGSLGVLMQDLSSETNKRLKDLEKAYEGSMFEVKNIPNEFVKGLRKMNWHNGNGSGH